MKMRISTSLLLIGLCCGLTACEDKNAPPSATKTPGPVPRSAANSQPDNTANNHPDYKTSDKTSGDQSETKTDVGISAEIRKSIMKTENMSTNAQNVKIITDKGVVTLRGPVDTQAEKDTIEKIATQAAGVTRVDNLLEVKAAP
jgi:hyperosmotically inducible protein